MAKLQWTKTNSADTARATFLMYGLPGAGKTTLATTLPRSEDGKVVYAAADPGQLVLRGCGFNSCRITEHGDMVELRLAMQNWLTKDPNKVEWLIIDGLDECGELALEHYLRTNKDGRAAYGEMADFMAKWTKDMRDLPCNVLFITHIDYDTSEVGERYARPSFPGKQTHKVLVNWFDFVGCLRFKQDAEGKQTRMIQFKGEVDPKYTVKERGYGEFKLSEWEQPNMAAILTKLGINKVQVKETA